MTQTLQTQTRFVVQFEDLRKKETLEKLVQLIRYARERERFIKITRRYDYIGDVVPAGIWTNYVEFSIVEEDDELDRIAEELHQVYPYRGVAKPEEVLGFATLRYEFSDTARPSYHKYFVLWLPPEGDQVPNDYEYARRIISLIEKLDKARDAVKAFNVFIQWCSRTLYIYTSRGNLAKIFDAGGDYPWGYVVVTYWG